MKHILYAIISLLTAFGIFSGAQAQTKQNTVKDRFFIMETEDSEYLYNFESSYLENSRRIRIFLPHNYNDSTARYNTVYVLDAQNLIPENSQTDPENNFLLIAEKLIKQGAANDSIVVAIDGAINSFAEYSLSKTDENNILNNAFTKFLALEVVPYIDNNYRTVNNAGGRILLGKNFAGTMAFVTAVSRQDTFKNIIALSPVFKDISAQLPDILSLNKPGPLFKAWIDAPLYEGEPGNASYVSSYAHNAVTATSVMESKNYRFAVNYLTYFPDSPENAAIKNRLNYAFSFINAQKPLVFSSAKPFLSHKELYTNNFDASLLFALALKYKGGIEATYIPAKIRAVPPFAFISEGFLTTVRGAEPSEMDIRTDFGNKTYKTSVKLLPEAPEKTVTVTFEVKVPQDFADKSIAMLSPYWDKVVQLSDTDKKNIKSASVELPALSNYAYNFVCLDNNAPETDGKGNIKAPNVLKVLNKETVSYTVKGFK